MPPVVIAAGIAGVGAVASSVIGGNAAKDAANTQAQAAQSAQDSAQQIYDKQAAVQKPYVDAGLTGQNRLMELLGVGGNAGAQNYGQYATANFTPEDYLANQDPGYAFSMSEGLKALDRTAAARGGALSGGAIKGALQYSQGLASQDYQNAFNRYQTQRNNTLNPYQQLQGVGQAAAAGQAANLGALGSAQQQAITGAANATSAGQIAGANIAAGGINSGVNALTNLLASRQSSYTPNNGYGNQNNYGSYDPATGSYPYLR